LMPLCKAQMERTGMFAVATTGHLNANSLWVFLAEEPFETVVKSGRVTKHNWDAIRSKSVSDDLGSTLSYLALRKFGRKQGN